MKFTVVTLFAEIFESFLRTSLVGKAVEFGRIQVSFVDPRDFADDRHRTVDDTPYGGGEGMVLKADIFVAALEGAEAGEGVATDRALRVLLCPQGEPLTQRHLRDLQSREHVVLVCGRYEGFDERIRSHVDREISLGDFVLNGGEVAAMAVIDGVSRLIPGVIGNAASLDSESHGDGLLEYPQYTRPREFRGEEVPEVLLSGDHKRIEHWRRQQMLLRTRARRPDLFAAHRPTAADRKLLAADDGAVAEAASASEAVGGDLVGPSPAALDRARWAARTYIALLHHPVYDRKGRVVTTALTNLDLHDIARSSRTYGLAGYFIVTPLPSQQDLAHRITAHWREGHGANVHEKRKEALSLLQVVSSMEDAQAAIEAQTGQAPITVATSARPSKRQLDPDDLGCYLLDDRPLLILLGTGWGLTKEVMALADLHLAPIRGSGDYNHLSVRSAAAIVLDRCFGMRD